MESDLLEAQPFGLTPKRGEKHESDETTASADRVAKLGSRSYPDRCKRLLLRSRRPPSCRDNRSCGQAHLVVAKKDRSSIHRPRPVSEVFCFGTRSMNAERWHLRPTHEPVHEKCEPREPVKFTTSLL